MKQQFEFEHSFRPDSLAMIGRINVILDDYDNQGFKLTLRQLYYQLVSRNLIENTERSYKNTGTLVSEARLAGLIDWDMIEDRGRVIRIPSTWESPGAIIDTCARAFRINKWADQSWHVEVMVEKQALEGVLEPICTELQISLIANKGYSSSSAMYEAGRRLLEHSQAGKEIMVIYLGDHDPSGIDMTRDVEDRLKLFTGDINIDVRRVALNMDQIRKLKPPENPAKTTDSRSTGYIEQFGMKSWELDAVEPKAMAKLVKDAVAEVRDMKLWAAAEKREAVMRETLKELAEEHS